jgi:hypothetical protein
MIAPPSFQVDEACAFYRPEGRVLLSEAIELMSASIAYASENQIGKILVDSTRLTGFPPLNTSARFWMVERFVAAAKSVVKVAVLARSEMIDPDRFGVTVAKNLGLQANVFDSEADALAWLLSEQDVTEPPLASVP